MAVEQMGATAVQPQPLPVLTPCLFQLPKVQISSGYFCNVTCWVNICTLERGMGKALEIYFWHFFRVQSKGVFPLISCL